MSDTKVAVACVATAGLVDRPGGDDDDVRGPLLLVQADMTSMPSTSAIRADRPTENEGSLNLRTRLRCVEVVNDAPFATAE